MADLYSMAQARLELLEQITDRLSDAVQADLESGVTSLNFRAAVDFQCKYPAIYEFMKWINDLYFEEMPND